MSEVIYPQKCQLLISPLVAQQSSANPIIKGKFLIRTQKVLALIRGLFIALAQRGIFLAKITSAECGHQALLSILLSLAYYESLAYL